MTVLTRAQLRKLIYTMLDESEQQDSNPKWPPETVNIYIYKALCEVVRRSNSEFFTQSRIVDALAGPANVPQDFLCGLQLFFGREPKNRRRLVPMF